MEGEPEVETLLPPGTYVATSRSGRCTPKIGPEKVTTSNNQFDALLATSVVTSEPVHQTDSDTYSHHASITGKHIWLLVDWFIDSFIDSSFATSRLSYLRY